MAHQRVRLELFGPLAGRTVLLNQRHQFVDGLCDLEGPPDALAGAVKYLGQCYQAYVVGTPEHDAAVAAREEETASGEHGISPGERARETVAVPGDVQPERQRPAQVQTDDGGEAAQAKEGATGVLPEGDGQEDAGIPDQSEAVEVDPALAEVVLALDPDNDDHWTKSGKPAVGAIEEGLGSTGITRADIKAAVPGWNREKAQELKILE